MNIGIDIDGVLIDCEKYQIEKGKEYLGLPVVDEKGYDIKEIFNVSTEIDNKFWHDNIFDYAIKTPYKENAPEVIQKLRNDGHKIYIITSRCEIIDFCSDLYDVEKMRSMVIQSLKSHNIPYDEIIFTRDKSLYCSKHDVVLLIDDSTDNLDSLKGTNCVPICFSAKYNEDFNYEYRVFDWNNAYNVIKSILGGITMDNTNNVAYFNVRGLKCDHEGCDYNNPDIPVTDYPNWINKPCPKCGHSLLTQEDFDNVLKLMGNIGLPWKELLDKVLPDRDTNKIITGVSVKMNGTGALKFEEK